MDNLSVSSSRAHNSDSEIFMGALSALYRHAENSGEKDCFIALLAHWTTPEELRLHSSLHPIKLSREKIVTFIKASKESAKTDEETGCLNAILQRSPTLDFAPANYLLGCT